MTWRERGWAVVGLVLFVCVYGILLRFTAILNPLPCMLHGMYGVGSERGCDEALRAGAADPWAPYVKVGLLTLMVGTLCYFAVAALRDRDWKSLRYFAFIGIGWALIILLELHHGR